MVNGAVERMTEVTWSSATDAEEIIAFLRAERGKHRDHAFVPPRAVERCVRSGQAWVAHDSAGVAGIALGSRKTLWNLIIREDLRGLGLGRFFLSLHRFPNVRAKVSSDKRIGSPIGFYERLGYWTLGDVPSTMGKKTIVLMSRVQRRLPDGNGTHERRRRR